MKNGIKIVGMISGRLSRDFMMIYTRTLNRLFLWKIFYFLRVFSLVLVLQASALAMTPAEIYQTCSSSVVTIYSMDGKERIHQGSGFFVNNSGALLTNFHVIEDSETIVIEFEDGDILSVGDVLAQDPTKDLALLSAIIPVGKSQKAKPVKFAPHTPNPGETVFVIGTPKGLSHTISDGILSSAVKQRDNGDIIQFTAPVSHGSSGSPVFNDKGQVIGIVTFSYKEAQNLNFAVSQTTILQFLKDKPMISMQEAELKKRANSAPKNYLQASKGDLIFISGQYKKEFKIILKEAFKSTVPGTLGIHFWFGIDRPCELKYAYTNNQGMSVYVAPEDAGWAKDAGVSILARGDTVGVFGYPEQEELGWFVDYSNFMGISKAIRTRPFKQTEFSKVEIKPEIYYQKTDPVIVVYFEGIFDNNLIFSTLNTYRSKTLEQALVSLNKIPGYFDIGGGVLNIDHVDKSPNAIKIYYEWDSSPVK